MELNDFLTVVVAFNSLEKEAYTAILRSAGLPEPVVVDRTWVDSHREISYEEKKGLAKEVEQVVGDKPSVIMCRPHYAIAVCYNKTPIILFDNHYDGYDDSDKLFFSAKLAHTKNGLIPEFNNQNFLLFRLGEKYILGTRAKSDSPNIETYPPSKVYDILNVDLNEFFLSLEIDVYNPSVTTAYDPKYGPNDCLEKICQLIGYERRLDSETVLDLSKKLVSTKKLVGLDITGYEPERDASHKTADLLKNYLREVLQVYITAKK